jgi:predicted RNase H-like nuclease (RuvC/YqgF family)|tara:strand:+ start:1627 stop:2070 length:444 start_codon:yes stop_codon:yes gene_type:complete
MKLTLNQAAKECGRAKSTLSKAIKSGKLSAERGDKGAFLIDPSELHRVFPATSNDDQTLPMENTQKTQGNSSLQSELDAVRRELETVNLERDRERSQLTDQIEDLRRRLDTEGEERRKLTAMLTDQRAQEKPQEARRGFLGLFRASA